MNMICINSENGSELIMNQVAKIYHQKFIEIINKEKQNSASLTNGLRGLFPLYYGFCGFKYTVITFVAKTSVQQQYKEGEDILTK